MTVYLIRHGKTQGNLERRYIGRTDQPGGDYDRLMESIRTKLLDMDGDVTVIPGHGPTTTIADERTKNPFLVPFNFPNDEGEE